MSLAIEIDHMKTFIFLILFFASSVFAQEVWHYPPRELPDNVKEWVHLEVKVNAGSSAHRTGDPLRLEYVEIPVKDLNVLEGLGLRGILRSSLAFTRQGERYIRWIFNPEDKLYKGEILKELERISGQKPKIKNDRFIGYLTASRSVIVQDAVNGAIFSLKASTNFTGGNWHDKKMNSIAARISKAFNDFIFRNQEKDKLKTFVALGEPLAVILPGIDISFTIRDYPIFSNSKIRVLPFFSALHPTFGKEFAEQRGEDPVS
ncbi:MAG: hypothetical protein ACAH59_08010 [Pseudobdellovibrionaceae bacterium]